MLNLVMGLLTVNNIDLIWEKGQIWFQEDLPFMSLYYQTKQTPINEELLL